MSRPYIFDGSFYSTNKNKLTESVNRYITNANSNILFEKGLEDCSVYVTPHAGYVYSGSIAGYTFASMYSSKALLQSKTIIVIGPNHTGIGSEIAISEIDWESPYGIFKTDKDFVEKIISNSKYASINEDAHTNEHSIEVQLPFLYNIGCMNKKFVFICMGDQDYEHSLDLADSIIKAERSLKNTPILLASSDFNHYESEAITKKKDEKLFSHLYNLEHKKFNAEIKSINSSACGYGPITTSIIISKSRGASKGILLNYSNSGKITNNYNSVVSYASWALV